MFSHFTARTPLVALACALSVFSLLGGCHASHSLSPKSAVNNATVKPTLPIKADGKTYKEPGGAFQISFPKGYEFRETGTGIKFTAPDGGFKGFVDFAKSDGALNDEKLEGALREYLTSVLKDVKWQNANLENQGRIRIDWTGKGADGEQLDAISYIEQRNNRIYILSLYGVDRAFDKYREDAEAIVRSYRTQPQGK